jgi:transcriptional regulator with XRE-family HTH domain
VIILKKEILMIKNRLKELRLEFGLTQKELGEKIGVNDNTITNYEKGKREPYNSTLCKLANIFNCTTDYLLGRVEKRDAYISVVQQAKDAKVSPDVLEGYIRYLKSQKDG